MMQHSKPVIARILQAAFAAQGDEATQVLIICLSYSDLAY